MGRLDGTVALITGAGHGQGAAGARLFASEGAAVAVADVNAPNAELVAKGILADGGRAIAIESDVSDPTQVEAMVSRTPVMGLNRNGLPELVDGGRHGFLVDRADPSALAEAIVSAVSDPERLESMAATAQRHVVQNYSWGRVAERIAYSS